MDRHPQHCNLDDKISILSSYSPQHIDYSSMPGVQTRHLIVVPALMSSYRNNVNNSCSTATYNNSTYHALDSVDLAAAARAPAHAGSARLRTAAKVRPAPDGRAPVVSWVVPDGSVGSRADLAVHQLGVGRLGSRTAGVAAEGRRRGCAGPAQCTRACSPRDLAHSSGFGLERVLGGHVDPDEVGSCFEGDPLDDCGRGGADGCAAAAAQAPVPSPVATEFGRGTWYGLDLAVLRPRGRHVRPRGHALARHGPCRAGSFVRRLPC